jgi:hypothetical protein
MKLSLKSLLPRVDRGWNNLHTNCSLRTCPNTLFIRSVQSRVGINVGETWYCSPDCLAAAASLRFSELMGTNVLEMPHSPRMSIGLVMLSNGYLTDHQLRLALAQSQVNGEELETVLLRLGFANQRQVTAARAAQWGYPVLGREHMNQVAELDIPVALLRSCSAAPVHCSLPARRLLLGFVYRVDHSLLNSLEQMTGFRVEPCFIAPTDFVEQMERLATAPRCEEIVCEDLQSARHMGKTVGAMAVEVGARDVRFTHCRDYAWTRLTGQRLTIDALFRIKNSLAADGDKLSVSENIRSAG